MTAASAVRSQWVRRAWSASPALVVHSAAQLVALMVFCILALLDDTVITGQPAWIKPAKFAASTAIYGATLAWMLSFVEGHRRAVLWIGRVTVGVMVIEVGLIGMQAARGVASHFNIATPLDAAIFSTMGFAILVAWFAGWAGAYLLIRQRFADPALAFALRAGLIVSLIGAGLGGLMTQPTAKQMEGFEAGEVSRAGAHAVGAPEDAPGLPFIGWNTRGGDLRVPHFFGLHAMQVLPGFAVLLAAARSQRLRRRSAALVRILSASYLLFVGVLTLQALRAESFAAPGGLTLSLLGALVVATAVAGVATSWRARAPSGERSLAAS